MANQIIIGSDTRCYESVDFVTGIQRVVHDLHVGLVDRLSSSGISLVPMHTSVKPRRLNYLKHPDLADDPVLDRKPRLPDDLDVVLLTDLGPGSDYRPLHLSLQKRPRPVIAIVYDILPLTSRDTFDPRMHLGFRLYLQQILRLADHVVVTSRDVEESLRSLRWSFKGQVHVLPLGSTFTPRRPENPPDRRLSILNVSTIEPRKGHALLIDAFDILRRDGLDIDLSIIGRSGWSMDGFMDFLRQHPDFGTRIRWFRGSNDGVLTTQARRCSIGVLPSCAEGFGLFLEEGLALGLKMVVSDIPVFREREWDNVTFSARDPESFAHSILTAHEADWVQPKEPIRLMSDFIDDFAALIGEVVNDRPKGTENR